MFKFKHKNLVLFFFYVPIVFHLFPLCFWLPERKSKSFHCDENSFRSFSRIFRNKYRISLHFSYSTHRFSLSLFLCEIINYFYQIHTAGMVKGRLKTLKWIIRKSCWCLPENGVGVKKIVLFFLGVHEF